MTRAQFNYKIANGSGSLILKNCKKSLFKRFEIHGKSEQVTTTGANLIPFKVGEKIESSSKGNSVVFEKDGVNITINTFSNATESDLYFFGSDNYADETGYSDVLPAGEYTFLSNSKLCNFFVVVWRNGTTKILVEGSSEQITHFTILDGDKVRLMLRPKGNANLKGTEKAQVMLCKHTETNLPYEPYTDGKPSPSQEYPQNIVSVGKKGKNLFDINKFPYKQDDDTILINSNQAYGGAILVKGDDLRYTQHVISFESYENIGDNTSTVLIEVVYKDGVKDERYLTAVPKAGWVLSSTKEIDFIWIRNPWKAGSKIKKLQIEEGKEATEYEPYSDKFFVDVEVAGKNLVPPELDFVPFGNNDPKTIEFDPKTNSYKLITRPDNFNQVTCCVRFNLRKGTYIISRKIQIDGVNIERPIGLQVYYADTKKPLYNQEIGIFRKFILKEDTNVLINLGHITEKTQKEAIIYEVQLEKSDVPTPYEPYHEPQTVRLELNEPLRGIGEYKDVITKDGILRKILQVRIADYLQKYIYGKPGGRYIFSEVPNCYINYNRKTCMSNVGFTTNQEDITYMPVPYLDKFKLGVADDDTVETIREKVKDVVVAYTVKEPILEALPTELELALSNLYTNDGTTIINVDSGEVETGIEVEYAVKE